MGCLKKILSSNFLVAILYVIVYRYIHVHYLVEIFGYLGYEDNHSSGFAILFTNIIAVLPILFYNKTPVASNFISIILYFFIYVPTILTTQYTFQEYNVIFPYHITFLFSMILFFLSSRFGIKGSKTDGTSNYENIKPKGDKLLSSNFVCIVGLIFMGVVVAGYGSSLKVVSLNEVYDVRGDNADILEGNPILNYLSLWLTYFFIPFFVTIGFFSKKKFFIILSLVSALLIYAAAGSKAAIFAPFFAIGLYYILKWVGFNYILHVLLSFVIIIFFISQISDDYRTIPFIISAIILMRTVSISGFLAPAYIHFFDLGGNPYTYYNHIGIINKIFKGYPYDGTMGKVVWGWYRDMDMDIAMNANANFLLTDGIAAMGIPGVILISVIFFFILALINKVSARHNKNFVFVILIGATMAISNVSLFTSLLSCGMILIMLYLRFSTPNLKLDSPVK